MATMEIYKIGIAYADPDVWFMDLSGSVKVFTCAKTFKGIARAIGREIARTYGSDVFEIRSVCALNGGRPVSPEKLLAQLTRRPEIAAEAATEWLFERYE